MTREEDDPQSDPCVAALLAVTLVSQVLDEASVIANAAKDSGHPWQYLSNLKKLRSSLLNDFYDEDLTFMSVSNGDSQYLNNNIENLSNIGVTSTPQKVAVQGIKSRYESNIMGQGDEEFEVSKVELRKSTSMIINHLFDMSDVEHLNICDEVVDTINKSSDSNEVLITAMTKLMDSYVNNALDIVFGQEFKENDTSSYSFLSDCDDIPQDPCLNINDEVVYEKTDYELTEIENEKKKINTEVAFYENAYLTLNRDYEQYSEDEEPVLQDPKAIPMQEVELLTANTSSENIQPCQKLSKELPSSGMSTSAAGSRKSSIVRRCRLHGARLLSCLRGWWWRRKLPGRRKIPRAPGSIRGLCPLSPDARRRTTSLLDQRHLRTPSPSTSMVWKFNTVNEALVHSSRWKEFGLKMSLNENDEF